MTDDDIRGILELALLTSQAGPLSARALARMFADEEVGEKRARAVLGDLAREWEGRALELRETAGGFQFVSREGTVEYLRRLSPRKPPRLSRPLTEILAFIAYRQPATRGDIEQVRGTAVSSQQIAALEEYGWIEEVGRRQTPGRPALYATTKTFLDDLGLAKLEELPAPEEFSEAADHDGAGDNMFDAVGQAAAAAEQNDGGDEGANEVDGAHTVPVAADAAAVAANEVDGVNTVPVDSDGANESNGSDGANEVDGAHTVRVDSGAADGGAAADMSDGDDEVDAAVNRNNGAGGKDLVNKNNNGAAGADKE